MFTIPALQGVQYKRERMIRRHGCASPCKVCDCEILWESRILGKSKVSINQAEDENAVHGCGTFFLNTGKKLLDQSTSNGSKDQGKYHADRSNKNGESQRQFSSHRSASLNKIKTLRMIVTWPEFHRT